MLEILAVTGPIYLLIALGYLSGRRGVFQPADLRVLGQYVVQYALSALMFRAVSQRQFAEIMNGPYLLAYAGGSVATMLFGFTVARLRGRRLAAASFYGAGMAVSNNGLIGVTLVSQVLGAPAMVGLALCLLVENAVMSPLLLTLAESEGQDHLPWYRVAAQSLARVLRVPFVLAILVGLGVSALGLPVPAVLMKAVDLLAMSASAVALFVIGGTLVGRSLLGQHVSVVEVMLGKLVLHPLVVLGLLLLLPPIDPVLRFAAVAYAGMPMFSIYPILAQKYGEEGFCAAALVLTTVVSFITISGWLWVLRHLLGWG